jgi:hypothetical protein
MESHLCLVWNQIKKILPSKWDNQLSEETTYRIRKKYFQTLRLVTIQNIEGTPNTQQKINNNMIFKIGNRSKIHLSNADINDQ